MQLGSLHVGMVERIADGPVSERYLSLTDIGEDEDSCLAIGLRPQGIEFRLPDLPGVGLNKQRNSAVQLSNLSTMAST